MADFKKLLVWQKSYALALQNRKIASGIRGSDNIGLRSQIVRAGDSIPANIVEGRKQESPRQFVRYLTISLNSAAELEFHLLMAKDLELIPMRSYISLLNALNEVARMLTGLINSVRTTTPIRKPPITCFPFVPS
jgi:four helix bundle protein